MNWSQYVKYLDERIADTWHNMEHAEKEFRKCKAMYDSAMKEREAFDKAMIEKLHEIEKQTAEVM